jgi:ribonuclease D
LHEDELPPMRVETDGPPPAHRWSDRDPVAAGRLERARAAVVALADELRLPAENLISPETVRRLAWQPPDPTEPDSVAAALRGAGAREWQASLTAGPLSAAILAAPTAVAPESQVAVSDSVQDTEDGDDRNVAP